MIGLKTKIIVSILIGAMFVFAPNNEWNFGSLGLALFFLALVWLGK